MKTITGKEAVELIESAEAVIVMDGNQGICYASVDSDENDFTNIDITYDDGENDWEYSFKIWNDDTVHVDKNQIFLTDSDTQELIGIKLLTIQNL